MPGVIGIVRSSDQNKLVAVFSDHCAIIDMKNGQAVQRLETVFQSGTDRHFDPSILSNTVVRMQLDTPYVIDIFNRVLAKLPWQTDNSIDVYFQGKNVSFGKDKNGKLVLWKTGSSDYGNTPDEFRNYVKMIGNPDSGVFALMYPPYEHNGPSTTIVRGTSVLEHGGDFVQDVSGDKILRSEAKAVGLDVTPRELYAVKAPEMKLLWKQKKPYSLFPSQAFWFGQDVISSDSHGWNLVNGATGEDIARLPELDGAAYVITVENGIFAYFEETSTLKCFEKVN